MATKTGDVMFTLGSTDYNYMLAQDENGQRYWSVKPLFMQPPILLEDKIDLTILAAPDLRQADGDVLITRTITTIAAELRLLIDSLEYITLDGYDGVSYDVMFDQTAGEIQSVLDPSGRLTHYAIKLSCWHLCKA